MNPAPTDRPVVLEEFQKLLDRGEQVISANRKLLKTYERDRPGRREGGRASATSIDLSVVVPIFDEQDSIRPLHQELVKVLDRLGLAYELLFVDDGSTDGSYRVLADLHAEFPSAVRVIQLRANFGKSTALQAGFEACRGRRVVTIDGDLQDDPAEIPRLLAELEAGYDLVTGWKISRRDPWTKTVPSRLFNWVVSRTMGLQLHDANCGFKAYRREVLNEIHLYGELHRFIPALAAARGFKVEELPVHHRPRRFGASKFGTGRLLRGFLDFLTTLAVTKFHRRPFHLFGLMGMGILGAGLGINAYLTVGWLQGRWIENRPLFMLGVLMIIVGIQVIFFGLLADLSLFGNRRQDPPPVRERLDS